MTADQFDLEVVAGRRRGADDEDGADDETPCPLGFICDDDGNQESCADIQRRAKRQFNLGDIFAGAICPFNSSVLENCPAGSYCPNPSTEVPCPSGKFCPHKTAVPEINCQRCDEGSPELEKQTYGYVIICILALIAFVSLVIGTLRHRNRDFHARMEEIRKRRITRQEEKELEKRKKKQLQRMKAKLEVIAERIQKLHNKPSAESFADAKPAPEGSIEALAEVEPPIPSPRALEANKSILFVEKDDTIVFDAEAMFDALDVDSDGELSFVEINEILSLNRYQLSEFVAAMNEMGGASTSEAGVSKPVFIEHFLDTLELSTNFGPTDAEAGQLFDELAIEVGVNQNGEIDPNALIRCQTRLSSFLSDPQINALVKEFRKIRLEETANIRSDTVPEESESSSRRRAASQRTLGAATVAGYWQTGTAVAGITKDEFVAFYPDLLEKVTSPTMGSGTPQSLMMISGGLSRKEAGIDISFQDLSLTVSVFNEPVRVVDNVTGRLEAGTLTAVMGGSGSGKTSLINSLCGRAFYGEVTGDIKVNGNEAKIEDKKSLMGFVPQDDIVYAELTVKENFLYAGRFQLPADTKTDDIVDLADATMASLGLSRVQDSIVGDSSRRGISGGEKKRVSVGIELMKRPKILFLDEPTSGLDASSALLVMKCLKGLTEKQGVTICSVIHQPRVNIYSLFDSLILLGTGGKIVFHGFAEDAQTYFENLDYSMNKGESVADWLIDISTGALEPDGRVTAWRKKLQRENRTREGLASQPSSADDISAFLENPRPDSGRSSCLSHSIVRRHGPSSENAEKASQRARLAREELYRQWNSHFDALPLDEKEFYLAPKPYDLPSDSLSPPFFQQLRFQLRRNALVAWRNKFSKLIDTCIIVGAVIVISLFEGVTEVTVTDVPDVSYETLASQNPLDVIAAFPQIFAYALRASSELQEYAMKLGVIVSVLVGLISTKIITEKRLEFFREAASGYSVTAYYVGINIFSTLEQAVNVILSAGTAYWIRNSISSWGFYYLNFLMLSWLCVSWAMLLPFVVPAKSVATVTGFFMAFFGLLFCGGLTPVLYEDIYDGSPALAVFAGFLSPTRYFVEGMAVAEHRCLPEQSGFTVNQEEATNFPLDLSSFALLHLAQNDENVTDRSCNGWYWGVLPALAVGLTVRAVAAAAIHLSGRSRQAKKSIKGQLQEEIKGGIIKKSDLLRVLLLSSLCTIFLFVLSCWLILRTVD